MWEVKQAVLAFEKQSLNYITALNSAIIEARFDKIVGIYLQMQ